MGEEGIASTGSSYTPLRERAYVRTYLTSSSSRRARAARTHGQYVLGDGIQPIGVCRHACFALPRAEKHRDAANPAVRLCITRKGSTLLGSEQGGHIICSDQITPLLFWADRARQLAFGIDCLFSSGVSIRGIWFSLGASSWQ